MKYTYPAIFTPANGGGYLVQFVDSENWFTEGETLEEAERMADDVLNLMLLDAEEKKREIPTATKIEDVKAKDGEIVKVIHADTEAYAKKMAEIEANPIKYAREQKGWNIKQLAEFLNAPYRTIQDWNNGEHFPPRWIQNIIVEKIYSA